MEKVAQSGSARPTQSGLGLGGQWAWAWQTAEEHEFPSTGTG